jgi:hypothetical protein
MRPAIAGKFEAEKNSRPRKLDVIISNSQPSDHDSFVIHDQTGSGPYEFSIPSQ